MNLRKLTAVFFAATFLCLQQAASAAPINDMRTSISPTRVRLVLDSADVIKYNAKLDDKVLKIELPESSSKKLQPKVKDQFIKSVKLTPDGKNKSKLEIALAKDCQYKIYNLNNPHRLVVDIFRINIIKKEQQLAKGVTYTYIQDEMNGKQIQGYLVSVAKNADYELRPFSAAGTYNGRGSVAAASKKLGLLAATNASYFDTDGWVIGVVKDNNNIFAVDYTPRSGFVADAKNKMIVKDLVYTGNVVLPDRRKLSLKGMNRARIAEDCVLFNEYYGRSTKTNEWGREVKIRNGRVIAISTKGNMSIEPGTQVISAHGASANLLAGLRMGDKVQLEQTLGNTYADSYKTVIGGGPLLLENGVVNVRTKEEYIAPDIANGRAPRTAVGLKKDGTLLMLVVDGRNPNSAGLTLKDLAQYFLRLGARDAVNFDGGGSSEMVIRGQIVNRPSDGRERPVSIGIGLFPKS